MAVTHSTTADGSPLIGASDWNDSHTVANGSFVAAKLSATATDKVFGRSTAGAGNGEEIALTAAGRALIDDADAAAQRTTLGIATAITGTALDTLAATTDITTRNASTSAHGLLRKLDNDSSHFLNGQGGWTTPAGSSSLTRTEAVLGADVTLTTGGTYYDGPTITPAAGDYDVWARITFFAVGTGNRGFTGRLIANGSATPIDEAEVDAPSAAGNQYALYLSARVTANGTDPILVRGSSATNGDSMSRDPQSNSPSGIHRATILVITQIS